MTYHIHINASHFWFDLFLRRSTSARWARPSIFMFHIIIIIIIIIIIEGIHLRDGQDQAQAEGLRGGVAQAQDDQVTTLHREGPWSEFAK